MGQYINKDALVAEIERRKKKNLLNEGAFEEDIDIISFINTLEVKEVDLDYIRKELDELIRLNKPAGDFGWGTLYNVATHFFELGVNASNPLTWEDIKLIAEIGDKFMNSEESDNLSEEDYYKEILKRFKEQKGE